MFVPQWPTMATNDTATTSSSNNDDPPADSTVSSINDSANNLTVAMNGNKEVASEEDSASNNTAHDDDDVSANTNTITSKTTTLTDQSNDEGIEISSLIIETTNGEEEEKKQWQPAARTEYDMALHGGGSSGSSVEEEDEEDTMYQCQMWTASFPNDNTNDSSNNDNNDGDVTSDNNISEGISSAFATLGGGDIWSTEAFALHPSPLQDLLNSNTPLSLPKLLAEDELLQELKGCEVKLVEYFGREEVVADLVECVLGTTVPYYESDNERGGRERWCDEERKRRELREEERKNKNLELERLGSLEEEEVDGGGDEDDDKLHPNHKLFVSSPRENGEEPNVETQWISPAVSPVKRGGGWIFNRDTDDDYDDDEEEEQRTPEEEYDLRFIRYPYMACEVLCSEVGTTLDVLVDGYIDTDAEIDDGVEGIISNLPFAVAGDNGQLQIPDSLQPRGSSDTMFQPRQQTQQQQQQQQQTSKKRILDLIFAVLIDTTPSSLDDRRAGYLEKLLSMLFRRRSQTMAEYMNTSLILTSRSAPLSKQQQLLSSSAQSLAQLDTQQQQLSSSTIEKYPSLNAPPMLMCALLDHLHSHSIMHILQRLLVPSPLRKQGSSSQLATNKNGSSDDLATSTSSSDSDDDENPFSAPNNDFMNAINQMNGNQQMPLHDMDDEDVDDEDDLENDLLHLFQCDWSERPDCVLALLLDRLEGKTDSFLLEYGFPVGYSNDDSSTECDVENDDVAFLCSQHAAEILVTIIQNSSLNSPVMISLSSDPALKRIIDIASLSSSTYLTDESKEEQPEFVPHESKMTCAITVLESLVLQLGGYGAVGVEGGAAQTTGETLQSNLTEIGPHSPPPLASSLPVHPSSPDFSREVTTADTSTLVSHLPALLKDLSSLLTHPVTTTWHTPAQYTGGEPRLLLGTSRLRILRLVEALVLLGDASVDFDLQHSNILKHCIDLFWEFEWCSMLHQSVANFLVHVFEGGEGRSGLQEYFLENCQLMERLIDSFGGEDVVKAAGSDSNGKKVEQDVDSDDDNSSKKCTDVDAIVPVSEEDIDSAMEQESGCMDGNESPQPPDSEPIQTTSSISSGNKERNQIRKGYMGHVIIICQALAHATTNAGDECNDIVGDESNEAEAQATSPLPKLHTSPNQQESKSSRPSQISLVLQRDPHLFDKWKQFAASTLAFEMTVQSAPLGGQPLNNGQSETASSEPQQQPTVSVINDTTDDFLGEPSGHLIFGGSGAAVGDIDMDEIDLDIADSMMENLSLPSGESDDSQPRGRNRRRAPSKESNLGHNFGSVIPTTTGFQDYIYDDPLGGGHPFDSEDGSDKDFYKGSEDDDIMSDAMVVPRDDDKETASTSSDESSVEDENDGDDDDVPVMDLFAGNVSFENDENSGWANFDSFGPSQNDSNPPSNKSSEVFSFSKTPFDFVDTLEEGE